MSWTLAPCLAALRDEVDARWPNRSKRSDGTIGDAAHSSRDSQHNPDGHGVVTAVDLTSTNTTLRDAVLEAAIGHPCVWYVINRGHIWSRTYGWREQNYTGSNPHKDHIHISTVQTPSVYRSTRPWLESTESPQEPTGGVPPTLGRGDRHGALVPVLKRFLGVKKAPESDLFGSRLHRAVRRYQRQQALAVDGIVGPQTWARILTALDLPGYGR